MLRRLPSSWMHCGLECHRENLGLPLPWFAFRSARQGSQWPRKRRLGSCGMMIRRGRVGNCISPTITKARFDAFLLGRGSFIAARIEKLTETNDSQLTSPSVGLNIPDPSKLHLHHPEVGNGINVSGL